MSALTLRFFKRYAGQCCYCPSQCVPCMRLVTLSASLCAASCTLCSDVHQGTGVPAGRTSCCASFPNTKKVVVVRGKYPPSLIAGWKQFAKEWAHDEEKCQNENPVKLPASQLYTIMVVEHGGSDLESYHVEDFRAAKSIILQVI